MKKHQLKAEREKSWIFSEDEGKQPRSKVFF